MRLRAIQLTALILVLPTPVLADDLFKYAGIRTHGFHFLEGARAELGVVEPENANSAVIFGLNSSAGTMFSPNLDLTLGFRYWSADLDPGKNSGYTGTLHDFSLHGDLNYHILEVKRFRPYVLAGVATHFAGADVPGSSSIQDQLGGFGLGFDLGVGVATARKGLNFRFEARNEIADHVGNWNYMVGVGWWPKVNAVRVPTTGTTSTAAPAPTSGPPPAGGAPAAGGISYAEASALQSTIDRLTKENEALKTQTGGGTPAAMPAPTPESRAAAQKAAFQRMADLSGDPAGFTETTNGVYFQTEQFVGFPEGGSKLDSKDLEQIRRLAALLLMFPGSKAELQGHGDTSGSAAANQKVTTARGDVVRNELLRLGVPQSAVTAEGVGSTRPVADNATSTGRSANRRVSVRVTGAPPR